jgi:Na+/melibiose symporter-like transporter
MLIIIYILLAVFAGWIARNTQIGFVGFFLLSLIVTPFATLIVLMLTRERRTDIPST